MNDVHLLGNLVIDHILESDSMVVGGNNVVKNSHHRVGGLANMLPALEGLDVGITPLIGEDWFEWEAAKSLNMRPPYRFSPGPSSVSHIINHDGKRTSFTDWGVGKNGVGLLPPESNWTHISYIDVIDNLDIKTIRKKSRFLSADLCLSKPSESTVKNVKSLCKHLDYLFISFDEASPYMDGRSKRNGKVWYSQDEIAKEVLLGTGCKSVIGHGSGASSWADQSDCSNVRTIILDKVDTIGAGDIFAACFIKRVLRGSSSREKILTSCHKETMKILRRRQNGEI